MRRGPCTAGARSPGSATRRRCTNRAASALSGTGQARPLRRPAAVSGITRPGARRGALGAVRGGDPRGRPVPRRAGGARTAPHRRLSGTGQARPLRRPSAVSGIPRPGARRGAFGAVRGGGPRVPRFRDAPAVHGPRRIGGSGTGQARPLRRPSAVSGITRPGARRGAFGAVRRGDPCGRPVPRRAGGARTAPHRRCPGRGKPVPYDDPPPSPG